MKIVKQDIKNQTEQSCPLITFENHLDADQARQNVGPYLDQNYWTLL